MVGEEVGEDVSLTLAQPTLCLTTEHALTLVNHDVIVEEAQGVVVQLILDTLLTEMFHWVAIRAGASPSLSPLRIARRSNWDSGSVLLARGGFLRSLSNSSAIGGFLILARMPLRVLFDVILCRSHVI